MSRFDPLRLPDRRRKFARHATDSSYSNRSVVDGLVYKLRRHAIDGHIQDDGFKPLAPNESRQMQVVQRDIIDITVGGSRRPDESDHAVPIVWLIGRNALFHRMRLRSSQMTASLGRA
jgi:hypothetical protein